MAVPLSLLLCLVTAVVSLVAFNKRALMDALMFRPDLILGRREWRRLFSCALIHANAPHLIFNLIALHSFASCIEEAYSPWLMLAIYAASVLGASLLSLWLHHGHPYAALGASGGVCGVMFAAIFLVPGVDVGMLLLPIFIPGPVFAILYLVITFIALRRGKGNIGHDAHFGGAITGLLLAAAISPRNCLSSPWLFLACLAAGVLGLWILARDPLGFSQRILPFLEPERGTSGKRQRDHDEKIQRRQQQEQIDRILDKISRKGMGALSRKERDLLERESARTKPLD